MFHPGSLFFKENYYKDAKLEMAGRNLENTVAKLETVSWMPCKCSHLSVTFCQADDRKKNIIAAKWINVETWVVFKTGAAAEQDATIFPPLVFFSSCHTVLLMAFGVC